MHRSFSFRRIASPLYIVAAQSSFISPVNFRFFLSGANSNSRILFFQPDANSLIVALIRPLNRLLRGKAPHIQVIADRLQAQIHRIFLLDQSLYRLSSPECKWQFQLIWTTIRDCTTNFLFFMRKQFSVKSPRSPFIADLQCGLASFFPSLNPLADSIGAHSDKRSDFITLQSFFEQQNRLLSTIIQFF